MRPRDKRPSAWQAHRALTRELHWPANAELGDALTLGGALMGSLYGGRLAAGALASIAYEATQRELERRVGIVSPLLCYATNLLEPGAPGQAYCGLPHGHDGPHAFTVPHDDIPW